MPTRAPAAVPAACPGTRIDGVACRLCKTVCPSRSIEIGPGNLRVDQHCTGCGACHAVCPAGALLAPGPSDAAIADRAGPGPSPTIACTRAGGDRGAARVSCLARVSAAVLLRIARRGAATIRLVAGDCDTCPSRAALTIAFPHSWDVAEECAAAAGLHLPEVAWERRPAPGSKSGPAIARRSLFSRLVPVGRRAGAAAAPDAGATRGAAAALREELASLSAAPSGGHWRLVPLGAPVVGADCDGCGLCADVCPADALRVTREGAFRLHLREDACTACGACVTACARDAVSIRRDVAARRPRGWTVVAEAASGECPACGAPVPDGDGLCVGCRRRTFSAAPA